MWILLYLLINMKYVNFNSKIIIDLSNWYWKEKIDKWLKKKNMYGVFMYFLKLDLEICFINIKNFLKLKDKKWKLLKLYMNNYGIYWYGSLSSCFFVVY